MADEPTVTIHKNERPDSIEIGTPAKGGALKVYFDALKIEEAKTILENGNALLNQARIMRGE